MSDDYAADTQTTGTVAVGDSATGVIETAHDQDWFAVELVAGRTYQFDLGGSPSGGGTLRDTFLRAIYDSEGRYQSDSYNDDFGGSRDSRVTFTATESGTYYVRASGDRDETGSYTLSVTDVTPAADNPPPADPPSDTDALPAGATDLGDITGLSGPQFPRGTLDGAVNYYRFTLTEARQVSLGLRQQETNADLFIEDADGNVLHSGTNAGTANEWVRETLLAGTYYVRIEAQEAGVSEYVFRYGVSEPDAETVALLEAQQLNPPSGTIYEPEELVALALSSQDDDYSQAVWRAGTVALNGSATGNIETEDDRDWFAVELEAGSVYRIKLEGSETGQGTLDDPHLRGIYKMDGGDQHGNLIAGTDNSNGGQGRNSEIVYQATESGTYYIAAGANGSSTGTYKLSVIEIVDDYAADTGTTGAVTVGGSVTGDLDYDGDRDWFAVELEAGTVYRIDVKGDTAADYGGTLNNPALAVYDSSGNAIDLATDDNSGVGLNAWLAAFAPDTDGTYYIEVNDPGGLGTYTVAIRAATESEDDYTADTSTTGAVTVGRSATGDIDYDSDRDWFAVELEAETAYRIKLEGSETNRGTLDDPYLHGIYGEDGDLIAGTVNNNGGQGTNSEILYQATESGTFYIAAGGNGSSTGTYRLSVIETSDDYAADTDTTGTVTVGGSATGNLQAAHDRDWFAVELEAGTAYRIKLEGSETDQGTLRDPYLRGIYGEDGAYIAGTANDDGGQGRNSEVVYQATESGTHYIAASGWRFSMGTYKLSVIEIADDYTADTGTTGAVTVGGSVTGDLDYDGDRDWFAVELEAGTIYSIKLEGSPTDQGTLDDPYLRGIYDENGDLIAATTDDDSGEGDNSEVVYQATESGTYYIAAGAYRSTGTYKLSVIEVDDDYAADTGTTGAVAVDGSVTGDIEYNDDRDWFAVEFEAGTIYRIKLEGSNTDQGTLQDPYLYGIYDEDGDLIAGTTDDDDGVGRNSALVYQATESDTFYVAAGGTTGNGRAGEGTYRLSVAAIVDDDYAADTDTTGAVTVGGSATGNLEYGGDRDWFAVELEAGTAYRIKLEGSEIDQGLDDPYLRGIYGEDGDLIAGTTNDDGQSPNPNSEVVYQATESGTYYIAAGAYGGSMTGTYKLSVIEVDDDYAADTDTTGAITVGDSVTGDLDYDGDRDWFAMVLEAGTTYRIDVKGDTAADYGGTLHNPALAIHDSSGNAINLAADDNSGVGLNARLAAFAPDTDGTYYIEVNDPGGLGTYTVALQEIDVTDTI